MQPTICLEIQGTLCGSDTDCYKACSTITYECAYTESDGQKRCRIATLKKEILTMTATPILDVWEFQFVLLSSLLCLFFKAKERLFSVNFH